MVLGWRRAFCTSIPKEKEKSQKPDPVQSSRFAGFFSSNSNPSTPRMTQSQPLTSPNLRCKTSVTPKATVSSVSAPQSPRLHCKTNNSPRFFHRSTPSSPRSPSTFSLLKSSLRLSKSSCGICLHGVKTGQGTAIFTAECGHSFHFPCIAAHVKKQGTLTCPICSTKWKELHLLENQNLYQKTESVIAQQQSPRPTDKRSVLKIYNDDEPLSSPTSGARFNPIPESDETDDADEFPGFFTAVKIEEVRERNVEFALLSEAAVVSVGKSTETYAVVLRIKAPAAQIRRAPIDLVTVLNVSSSITPEKMHLMKKAMRLVVSSLSAADRLSIVAYSSTSKRLLPLRRMTTAGKRAARRIIDAAVPLDCGSATTAADSIKKAAKVLEDRREINPVSTILIFSDGLRNGPVISSTVLTESETPVHSISLSACMNAPPDYSLPQCVTSLLSVVAHDVSIQLGFKVGSAPGEITAVYSYVGKPAYLGSGSNWCRVGSMFCEEERELLIELKVPSSHTGGSHRLLSVRCAYKDPSTQQVVQDKERPLLVPRPRAVGSSTRDIQRLRCLFVTTRAIAESRRLVERNDVVGAHHMLSTARVLVLQSGTGTGEEFVRGLEAELADLSRRRFDAVEPVQGTRRCISQSRAEEKAEPLTPTSAWRAAERLAKVAIMRKSLNRVSDLHGFENARF